MIMAKIIFGHAKNGSSTVAMSLDDEGQTVFDYVAFVKHLCSHPEDSLKVEISDSYSADQKAKLQKMVSDIKDASLGEKETQTLINADDD